MARNEVPVLAGGDPSFVFENGPIFSDYLASNNVTSDRRFSFGLGYEEKYHVDFGPPQAEAMSSEKDLRYVDMYKDFYWSTPGLGFGVGDISEKNTYAFQEDLFTILDTGSSAILLSSDYFTQVVTMIIRDYIGTDQYMVDYGAAVMECFPPEKLPPIYFNVGGWWIEMLGEDYVIDASEFGDRSIC